MSETVTTAASSRVRIRFQVEYRALYWETLVIYGSVDELGNWNESKAVEMKWGDGEKWCYETDIDSSRAKFFEYKYGVMQNGKIVIHEAGANRRVRLNVPKISIRDEWQDHLNTPSAYLSSSFFEDVIFHRALETPPPLATLQERQINVKIHLRGFVRSNQAVLIIGNSPHLGNWNPDKAVQCSYQGGYFEANFVADVGASIDYKFLIKFGNSEVIWEDGANRTLEVRPEDAEWPVVLLPCLFKSKFQWKGYGVAIPIFSLRTQLGLGVGEFRDLLEFVDFNVDIGSSIIQLLPINDTRCSNTWRDSYPYSALSVLALHPLYLHIPAMTQNEEILNIHAVARAQLNDLSQIDYEKVMETKENLTRMIFDSESATTLQSADYQSYLNENKSWLLPYASFLFLRKHCGTNNWRKWDVKYLYPTTDLMLALEGQNSAEYHYTYFIQYHLHKQLREVVDYAISKGVGLKGDLPIGVNPDSTDCWLNPHLFNMDTSTGAPPDQFSEDGQNWGFPTYNWDAMANDGYAWWKLRLKQMSQYFQAYRIDHILGFFRIWEIPTEFSSGLMGHFSPSIPISRDELSWKGIWDINRLIEPFITENFLRESFGNFYSDSVIETYFKPSGYGRYQLQSEFDTEKKINQYFDGVTSSDPFLENTKKILKKTLLSAIKNVVLLKDPHNDNHFYPRINMEKTSSFQCLDWFHQETLRTLYIDYYFQRQEGLWYQAAMTRLPRLQLASKMLVCGEDLGMIPACVHPVMKKLSIIGLCVQRMPSDSKKLFQHPGEYPYMTVCTPSSHDCSTIRGWWEEDRDRTVAFWRYIGMHGDPPMTAEDWICRKLFEQHMHAPSILAIFPIQELFSLFNELRVDNPRSEQINEPSNPTHYWRYRMHITVEELRKQEMLRTTLTAIARESERM